jgi:hypothetical protein
MPGYVNALSLFTLQDEREERAEAVDDWRQSERRSACKKVVSGDQHKYGPLIKTDKMLIKTDKAKTDAANAIPPPAAG